MDRHSSGRIKCNPRCSRTLKPHTYAACIHSITSLYRYIRNFDVLQWFVALVHLDVFNAMDNLEALRYPPEDCVLVVKPRAGRCSDEELATIRIWASIRHTQAVRSTNQRVSSPRSRIHKLTIPVMSQSRMELVFKFSPPNRVSTCPISKRIASLNHL